MRKVMKKYIKCFQSQISVYKYEVLKSQSDERAKNFQFCIVNNYSFHYQIFRQLLYYSSKYTFFARVGQKQILYRAKSTSTRFWFCLQKSKRNFPLEDSCALYWVMGDSFFYQEWKEKLTFYQVSSSTFNGKLSQNWIIFFHPVGMAHLYVNLTLR